MRRHRPLVSDSGSDHCLLGAGHPEASLHFWSERSDPMLYWPWCAHLMMERWTTGKTLDYGLQGGCVTGEADVRATQSVTGHVIPTLCPLSHQGYCYCPRSNSLLDIKLTRLQCPVSALCYLRPRLCWQLTLGLLRLSWWRLMGRQPLPLPSCLASGQLGLKTAGNGRAGQWQWWQSPPSAMAAITLLAMDASLQLKSTFPSHKSQFKSNN